MVARFRATSAVDKGREALVTPAQSFPFLQFAILAVISFICGVAGTFFWLLWDI